MNYFFYDRKIKAKNKPYAVEQKLNGAYLKVEGEQNDCQHNFKVSHSF